MMSSVSVFRLGRDSAPTMEGSVGGGGERPARKKLIEVALPLDAINAAAVREKSIRHGHPSTLHLWWARRPLAVARAVIFAQMVDDPSGVPETFPTPEAQEQERERLFAILSDLVQWENTTNEEVLERARREIRRSWARHCLGAVEAAGLTDDEIVAAISTGRIPALPGFHDPFAGGGTLPLEAQRLGLEAWASDLNPVAVTINKAMIEIPPRFAGHPPVNPQMNPQVRKDKQLFTWHWDGTQRLAADVRYYGQWMREEAEKRIGHLYPRVEVTAEMAADRPDLAALVGQKLTVIAWLWARTVKSPHPAFAEVEVPLVSTFILSSKAGREVYVEPIILGGRASSPPPNTDERPALPNYRFTVKVGTPPEKAKTGTKPARGANFRCLLSGTSISGDYIKAEGCAGRMGMRLMAIVAEGPQGRVYLPPAEKHEEMARLAQPLWKPATRLYGKARNQMPLYGMETFGDLFTSRQLVALTTFSDLVAEAIEKCRRDGIAAGLPDDGVGLDAGGTGALAYAQAVGVYLAFAVDKCGDYWSVICSWHNPGEKICHTFSRQAIPMVWDYAEANPMCDSSGNWMAMVDWAWKALEKAPVHAAGTAVQTDAQTQSISTNKIVSTDPPYYDNIGYADLSDFFYVWLQRTLKSIFPALYVTPSTPKDNELVVMPYRHGSREKAEAFFVEGMTKALANLARQAHPAFPVTIYYACKQQETLGGRAGSLPSDSGGTPALQGTASTGWETFLEAVIRAGFAITGTWPMRTELDNRMVGMGTNALASSIVLVCRKRSANAPTATRREFVSALMSGLPAAIKLLQGREITPENSHPDDDTGNRRTITPIAPVDLAQAVIGPGMALFTSYAQVIDTTGKPLSVREALTIINHVLEKTLAGQEADFDALTRFTIAWFEQYGFGKGPFGKAETLGKAKNISVESLIEAGIMKSESGQVRLLRPVELPESWDPSDTPCLTDWAILHHLTRVLETKSETDAAALLARSGGPKETVLQLAYRLHALCERRKESTEANSYNGVVKSWPDMVRLASARLTWIFQTGEQPHFIW